MRVLVAPDKFKGSLTAREVAARVAAGIGAEAPGVEVEQVPVADGGDGTLDAAVAAGFTRVEVAAHGPTGEPVTTAFAARDGVAVVEMADVSGLALLMPDRLDALGASSYGTGEVSRAALDHGCREIVLGIGGSASTDGGAGMVAALGARLLSSDGQELGRGGAALADLARLDLSGLHPALAEARVVVASDVDNPLLGPNGAAAVYGPQKGATTTQLVEQLERRLAALDLATAELPGAGAGGGIGGMLMALGATAIPGAAFVLDAVGFDGRVAGADLCITAEGRIDAQTLRGKVVAAVAGACRAAGVECIAVGGAVEPDGAHGLVELGATTLACGDLELAGARLAEARV
jgi:glycerate kinase